MGKNCVTLRVTEASDLLPPPLRAQKRRQRLTGAVVVLRSQSLERKLHHEYVRDPRMMTRESSAWVLGGSVAGLLAARALADHYDRVVIVERDKAFGDATPRKGAPQGRHVHALLPRGVAAVEKLFPGVFAEIIAAGATNGDLCGDAQWCPGGHRLKRSESDLRVIAATRPFIESFIAKRVTALANVEVLGETTGIGFQVAGGRIARISLRDRSGAERTEDADAVVDATGRGSQLPNWLLQARLGAAPEDRLDVSVRYATARFRRSTAAPINLKAAIIGASAGQPRGGIAQAVEDDVLQVSLAEFSNSPPTELEDFIEYAKTLPQPDLHNWMVGASLLDEIKTHGVPNTYRRHYDRVKGLPDGLLAIGDSVCAFNPVYAQGMTVAAVEAELLSDCLAKGKRGISRRFFRAIRGVTGVAWMIGSTNDLGLPQVEGKRNLITRLIGSWINRVQKAGTVDPYIAARFIRVAALLDPPSALLNPLFAVRVLGTKVRVQPAKKIDEPTSV